MNRVRHKEGKMKWIPVRDRLPKIPEHQKYEFVLVTDGKERGCEAVFHLDGTWFWDNAGLEPVEFVVTYWMPLPAPPDRITS